MKRTRGACKGCKCAAPTESGVFECMALGKKVKQPPKVCDKRIDAEREEVKEEFGNSVQHKG